MLDLKNKDRSKVSNLDSKMILDLINKDLSNASISD